MAPHPLDCIVRLRNPESTSDRTLSVVAWETKHIHGVLQQTLRHGSRGRAPFLRVLPPRSEDASRDGLAYTRVHTAAMGRQMLLTSWEMDDLVLCPEEGATYQGYVLPRGLAPLLLRLIHRMSMAVIFDPVHTLLDCCSMLDLTRKRDEALMLCDRAPSCATDEMDVAVAKAEVRLLDQDIGMLLAYTKSDCVAYNLHNHNARLEEAYSSNGEQLARPVVRLQLEGRDVVFTRIDPRDRDSSVLVRVRPGWHELYTLLASTKPGTAPGQSVSKFRVSVITNAERESVWEMWRLLDPQGVLIPTDPRLRSLRIISTAAAKSCFTALGVKDHLGRFGYNSSGKMLPIVVAIDGFKSAWERGSQSSVYQVPLFYHCREEAQRGVASSGFDAAGPLRQAAKDLNIIFKDVFNSVIQMDKLAKLNGWSHDSPEPLARLMRADKWIVSCLHQKRAEVGRLALAAAAAARHTSAQPLQNAVFSGDASASPYYRSPAGASPHWQASPRYSPQSTQSPTEEYNEQRYQQGMYSPTVQTSPLSAASPGPPSSRADRGSFGQGSSLSGGRAGAGGTPLVGVLGQDLPALDVGARTPSAPPGNDRGPLAPRWSSAGPHNPLDPRMSPRGAPAADDLPGPAGPEIAGSSHQPLQPPAHLAAAVQDASQASGAALAGPLASGVHGDSHAMGGEPASQQVLPDTAREPDAVVRDAATAHTQALAAAGPGFVAQGVDATAGARALEASSAPDAGEASLSKKRSRPDDPSLEINPADKAQREAHDTEEGGPASGSGRQVMPEEASLAAMCRAGCLSYDAQAFLVEMRSLQAAEQLLCQRSAAQQALSDSLSFGASPLSKRAVLEAANKGVLTADGSVHQAVQLVGGMCAALEQKHVQMGGASPALMAAQGTLSVAIAAAGKAISQAAVGGGVGALIQAAMEAAQAACVATAVCFGDARAERQRLLPCPY